MADSPTSPDPYDTGREPTTSAPRWVKVFGIVALVLIVLAVLALLVGGGGHGPGRHAPSGDAGSQTPPSSAQGSGGGGGHEPPAGGHTP